MIELIENIVYTGCIFLVIGLLVPQLIKDPPFWVKAVILGPSLISIPMIFFGTIFLIWAG